MITMIHANSVCIQNGMLTVDRKFHIGMEAYCRSFDQRLVTVNPKMKDGDAVMDPVEVPIGSLPYVVLALECDGYGNPRPDEMKKLSDVVKQSSLVYVWATRHPAVKMAINAGVPYILMLEYDLSTQIKVTTRGVSALRRLVRTGKCALSYFLGLKYVRQATALHCNGYPIFESTKDLNQHPLMYLESRISERDIISVEELETRLNQQRSPLKLLYSGRYEEIKGTIDAVKVAAECLRRGLDIELHCYGQGSQETQMREIAKYHSQIHIHDAIPFPELVEVAKTFDVFLCCHIQNDPSCTYLESMGAGLPIVGYGNRMWRLLAEDSGAGLCSPMGDVGAVADSIAYLIDRPETLRALSIKARIFARSHTWEAEFKKRVDDIKAHALQPQLLTTANPAERLT